MANSGNNDAFDRITKLNTFIKAMGLIEAQINNPNLSLESKEEAKKLLTKFLTDYPLAFKNDNVSYTINKTTNTNVNGTLASVTAVLGYSYFLELFIERDFVAINERGAFGCTLLHLLVLNFNPKKHNPILDLLETYESKLEKDPDILCEHIDRMNQTAFSLVKVPNIRLLTYLFPKELRLCDIKRLRTLSNKILLKLKEKFPDPFTTEILFQIYMSKDDPESEILFLLPKKLQNTCNALFQLECLSKESEFHSEENHYQIMEHFMNIVLLIKKIFVAFSKENLEEAHYLFIMTQSLLKIIFSLHWKVSETFNKEHLEGYNEFLLGNIFPLFQKDIPETSFLDKEIFKPTLLEMYKNIFSNSLITTDEHLNFTVLFNEAKSSHSQIKGMITTLEKDQQEVFSGDKIIPILNDLSSSVLMILFKESFMDVFKKLLSVQEIRTSLLTNLYNNYSDLLAEMLCPTHRSSTYLYREVNEIIRDSKDNKDNTDKKKNVLSALGWQLFMGRAINPSAYLAAIRPVALPKIVLDIFNTWISPKIKNSIALFSALPFYNREIFTSFCQIDQQCFETKTTEQTWDNSFHGLFCQTNNLLYAWGQRQHQKPLAENTEKNDQTSQEQVPKKSKHEKITKIDDVKPRLIEALKCDLNYSMTIVNVYFETYGIKLIRLKLKLDQVIKNDKFLPNDQDFHSKKNELHGKICDVLDGIFLFSDLLALKNELCTLRKKDFFKDYISSEDPIKNPSAFSLFKKEEKIEDGATPMKIETYDTAKNGM